MSGKPRSLRKAQALHATQLRGQGKSWAEIAAVFQHVYRVNPRVAMRQAHGWSQPEAAEQWTARWPDDPKSFKNFSYWEQWPGATGYAPSLDTLDRLAQLYQCRVTDLLADCYDYGSSPAGDQTARLQISDRAPLPGWAAEPGRVPAGERIGGERVSEVVSPALRLALDSIRQADLGALLVSPAGSSEPDGRLRRRTLLLDVSSALAVLAAAPILEVPRFSGGMERGRTHTDLAIVDYTADVVMGLRRLGGAVGPRITLPPAMALRSAMGALARSAPEVVTSRALTAYGDLTQLIGWLLFNLGDVRAAGYYYDDARAAAYRAGNADLIAYSLSALSQLASAQGRNRLAIDHALAAQQTARDGATPYAMAYAADVAARAYAAAGHVARCQAALDREQAALSQISEDTPMASWWYFYDRSFYWGTESECALRLGKPVDATDAARRSLGLVAPANMHNSALTLAYRAEALIRQDELEEGCAVLADAARITTLNSSRRISQQITLVRGRLHKMADTAAVRDLDEKLAEFRRVTTDREAADSLVPR